MPKNVFILGPGHGDREVRLLRAKVLDAIFIGDGRNDIPFKDFYHLKNADRIYVWAHGSVEDDEHFVKISSDNIGHTHSLLKHIFQIAHENPSREKSVEIFLESCYGGVAAKNLEVPANTIVSIMAGEHPSSTDLGMINMLDSTLFASLWDHFAKSILSYPDDKTIIAPGFRYTAKAPNTVLYTPKLEAFLLEDVNNYLYTATRYNPQMQSSVVPILERQVNDYRAERCFSFNDTSYLQTYLKAGYSPNIINRLGNSLLHLIASAQGIIPQATPASLQLLLDSGATVNFRNSEGMTPLHLAAFHGETDAATMLIAAGAEVNSQDNGGFSPLIRAAYQGHTKTMTALIDRGANISLSSNDGATALEAAIYGGNIESVRLLLDHNLDPASKSSNNISLSKLAKTLGHNKISDLLEERTASRIQSFLASVLQPPINQGTPLPESHFLASATPKQPTISLGSMASGAAVGMALGHYLLGMTPNKKVAALTTVAAGALLAVLDLAPVVALTLVTAGMTAGVSHVMQQNLRQQQGAAKGR